MARSGRALAAYADAHESEDAAETDLDWLARGHTLADAASLLWLREPHTAMGFLARASKAFTAAQSSFALTCAIASHGRARPQEVPIEEPADAMLASAWARVTGEEHWDQFRWEGSAAGRSPLGIPYRALDDLAGAARNEGEPAVRIALRVADRADDALLEAMADRWHWQRFTADVRPLDIELLAVGAIVRLSSGAEVADEVSELSEGPAAPVLAAGILADDLPIE